MKVQHPMTTEPEPCGTSCWHENHVPCTRLSDHLGKHEHRHYRHFAGAPVEGVLICTWRNQ